MTIKYYSIISISTSILSIVIFFLLHLILGAKLRKITRKSKKYQYVYIVLICLTFLVFGVVLITHSIKSEKIKETRGECCEKEAKIYQEEIIKMLKNSQSVLSKGLIQHLPEFQTSIGDLMKLPVRGVGNKITRSVDMTKLVKLTNDFKELISTSFTDALKLERLMTKIKIKPGISDECKKAIQDNPEIFEVTTIEASISDVLINIDTQIAQFRMVLGTIRNKFDNETSVHTENVRKCTEYVRTNFNALGQRLNDLIYKIIKEQHKIAQQPASVTWYDYANLIFYVLCILLAICSLAPILAAVITCLKKHGPPPLVKPSTIIRCAMCVSFFAVLCVSAWFAAMTTLTTGGFAAHDTCEIAVKAALADEYRVKTMNEDMKLVEKTFPQSCSSTSLSSQPTYFTDQNVSGGLISTSALLKQFDYTAYKTDVVTSIITRFLQPIRLMSPQYTDNAAKIAQLAAALNAMLPLSCATGSEMSDLQNFDAIFGKLAAEMPKYAQGVERFERNEMGAAFLRKLMLAYFDEAFVPIGREFETFAETILQIINSADFPCAPITTKLIKCSKCDEMDHLGLFFSALFGVSLMSLLYQALPSPWNPDKQHDNTTNTDDSMTPTKTKAQTTTATTDPTGPLPPAQSPDYMQKTIFDDTKMMSAGMPVLNVATARSNPQIQRKKSMIFKK